MYSITSVSQHLIKKRGGADSDRKVRDGSQPLWVTQTVRVVWVSAGVMK